MKKRILSIAVVATVAVAAAWGFNKSNEEVALSDVALSNVEALASGEGIPSGYRYEYVNHSVTPGSDGSPLHSYSCSGSGNRSCGH